jgi:phenylalanyl-tRNA synthetase beta chain
VKVLLSWIRDFVGVPGTAEEIGQRMSLRGLPLEGLETVVPGASPPWSTNQGADAVLDFEVTANRPDCLSMLGVAREIAAAYQLALHAPPQSGVLATVERSSEGRRQASGRPHDVAVTIEDPDLCARYAAAVAEVAIAPSPDWMQARLIACGVRPISNVVDITNYVLLERGHPMHAFDFARLRGPAIVVRRARAGERITTLDGKERVLADDMLVIADAERASAIGGVMGGADSEVSAQTTRIVLESAWFKPQSVRSTAKRLGLRTEASYRFERGADLTAPVDAMHRALELLELTGAGQASGPVIDCYPREQQPRELTLDAAMVRALLGMDVPDTEIVRILRCLGFGVKTLGSWQAAQPDAALPLGRIGSGWQITVPGWRVDVQRPVDLIEEVGRHHGFEHLPTTFPPIEQAPPPSDGRIARDARARRTLVGMGFSEAITFAFIDAAAAAPYADDGGAVALANPLSEKFTALRPSLLPGLVDAVSHNRRYGRTDVRLFEIGTRFSRAGETRGAALAWMGISTPEHWSGGQRDVDFFDVKGVAEQVCAAMGATASFVTAERGYLVAGRTADVQIDGHLVGVIGQLDPALAEGRDLPKGEAVYVAEFDLDALSLHAGETTGFAQPLPRHPSVTRDVAILIDDTLSADTVRGTIRSAAPATLVEIREFDRYHGKGIPAGKVSLAVRLTFRAPDRTLTDAEVHAAMEGIVTALTSELGAIQR